MEKVITKTPPIVKEVPVVKEKAQEEVQEISPVSETKKVIFEKNGSKWNITFIGPVSRREMNRLRMTMMTAWKRLKLKQQMTRKARERKLSEQVIAEQRKAQEAKKELVNA